MEKQSQSPSLFAYNGPVIGWPFEPGQAQNKDPLCCASRIRLLSLLIWNSPDPLAGGVQVRKFRVRFRYFQVGVSLISTSQLIQEERVERAKSQNGWRWNLGARAC